MSLLKQVIAITNNDKSFEFYIEYVKYANLGVRKKSHTALNRFIEIAENWDYEKRKKFCIDILSLRESLEGKYHLSNFILNQKILLPTLIEYTQLEPNNYIPFHHIALLMSENHSYELLIELVPELDEDGFLFHNKALELNPLDHEIRAYIICRLIDSCGYYPTHHLPKFYVQDWNNTPQCDLDYLIENFTKHIDFLPDNKQKDNFINAYKYYVQLISDYIAFKNSKEEDFTKFTAKLNRDYHWVDTYYYEK
ncbi:hypothetical protein AAEX28_10985 [Lentisphaerota bacterium WC36G]|nr:hypothetical protein LJT99_13825 [Lentisphaerae bacterium WC36]